MHNRHPFVRLPASACRYAAALLIGLPVSSLATAAAGAQPTPPATTARRLSAGDIDALPLREPGQRIAYGTDSLHVGEWRWPAQLPPGGRAPVAIVIHGGCWTAAFATLRNTAPLADALADAGVATWNVEYRRSDSPGGGWPGTLTDVAEAADYLRVLARQYPIDTTRIVAVGHSAGGQLALWLASRRTLPRESAVYRASPLPVHGVVSLGGITDLEEFSQRMATGCGRGVPPLLGGAPATVPDRVALASPIRRLPLGVPTVHIAGGQDAIAPDSVREAYRRAAAAAGDPPAANVTVPGGHFEVIAPGTEAGATVVRMVRALLGLTPPER